MAKIFLILLQRLSDNGITTIGDFTFPNHKLVSLEDTGRDINHDGDLSDPGEEKVYGKTRIPCGEYIIKLRTEGTLHEKYKKRFIFHRGMLHLQDVPHFKYIYIHILNRANQSMGCIGCGLKKRDPDYILYSTKAYTQLYLAVIQAMDNGFEVRIKIFDEKI